jgi:hypothetical protein
MAIWPLMKHASTSGVTLSLLVQHRMWFHGVSATPAMSRYSSFEKNQQEIT